MTELTPPRYVTTQAQPTRLPVVVAQAPAEPPLSPRMRAFVIGVRAALLLLCDALGELAGLPKRA